MTGVTLDGDRASRLLLPIVNPHLAPTATVVEGAFDATDEGFAFRRIRRSGAGRRGGRTRVCRQLTTDSPPTMGTRS